MSLRSSGIGGRLVGLGFGDFDTVFGLSVPGLGLVDFTIDVISLFGFEWIVLEGWFETVFDEYVNWAVVEGGFSDAQAGFIEDAGTFGSDLLGEPILSFDFIEGWLCVDFVIVFEVGFLRGDFESGTVFEVKDLIRRVELGFFGDEDGFKNWGEELLFKAGDFPVNVDVADGLTSDDDVENFGVDGLTRVEADADDFTSGDVEIFGDEGLT